MKILCTIGMRGGSKGVPNKNLKLLDGKPLMAYTIETAKKSKLFEHIVVSTDSKKIAKTAKKCGVETWFLRPPEFATDKVSKLPAIRHAFLEAEKHFNQFYDVLIDLDVTSPLRKTEDIISAFQQFIDEKADILITGSPSRKNPYFNMVEIVDNKVCKIKKTKKKVVCRQDAPKVYDMNASIYIWKREAFFKYDTIFTENTSLYIMPEERSIDIDTEMDWKFVEHLMMEPND